MGEQYVNFNQKTHHIESKFPTSGINMGKMPADVLSRNFIDVESFLHGTYFNNLENPRKSIDVKIKDMESVAFFKKDKVYLPEKLVMDKNRPTIFRR
jgi:hypothetical protein